MAISGVTSTCQITTNTQFELSGLNQSNLSSINITDENGLDVSECFGIQTNIIRVQGDNITLTGDCNTSLEIKITEGVSRPVECDIIRTVQEGNGLVTFFYANGTSSDNAHPECCTALGFTPEIDPKKCYYVCRWRDEVDPEDCNNYSPIFQETVEGWQIFEFAGGSEITTVPSIDCCYINDWVEQIQPNGEIKCIKEIIFDPCEGLEVFDEPVTGIITFNDPNTGQLTTIVPNSECCTSNGFNYNITRGGFECYNSLVTQPPEVTLSILNPCCEPTINVPNTCTIWTINTISSIPSGEGLVVNYINCDGKSVTNEWFSSQNETICAQEIISIDFGFGDERNGPFTSGDFTGNFGNVKSSGACN
jgi:hypothetical protein